MRAKKRLRAGRHKVGSYGLDSTPELLKPS